MNPVFTDPIASLLGNWAADITIGSILLRLLLSLVLGAIIGWERSNKRHSAGLRTFMLAFLIGTLAALLDSYAGDAKTGVEIVLRALEEPIRQIALNAGIDGSVIVDHIKNAKKPGYGYDALKGEYVDMVERGIIDPTKVTRSALQNAASIAAMILTTESLVADIPEPEPAAPAGGGMGGMY